MLANFKGRLKKKLHGTTFTMSLPEFFNFIVTVLCYNHFSTINIVPNKDASVLSVVLQSFKIRL